MKYRPEVDGLRALAVVPVIFFHAGFELFSGGFVGVDIFFVISGYLITTLLIEELENNTFSIVRFYERRARRILPALFFVMLCCIPAAWLWMMPSQWEDFSQSLIAVSFFASNILFWKESGYFDTEADEKPLLHTWSLAVEEQYYLLFPLFLLFVWRFGRSKVYWSIILLAGASLMLTELVRGISAAANFYLAPTRAWELLSGSITAFIVQRRGVQPSNTLSLAGLSAVVISIFLYDEFIPFPSLYTLLPVLGIVLLVLYASRETLAGTLLSSKWLVGIGVISYSAYLWHQPLFAFSRIYSIDAPSQILLLVLSIISFILASFSWRFVEQPFRKKNGFLVKRSTIFYASVLGLLGFATVGMISDSLSYRPEIGSHEERFVTFSNKIRGCFERERDFCNVNDDRPKIFVLGDSTMQPVAAALHKLQDRYAVVPITAPGCIVIKGFELNNSKTSNVQQNCTVQRYKRALDLLSEEDEPILVYGGMFNKVLTGAWIGEEGTREVWEKQFIRTKDNRSLEESILESINELSKFSKRTFVLEFPEFGFDAQKLWLKSQRNVTPHLLKDKEVKRADLAERHSVSRSLMQNLNADNVIVLDPLEPICRSDGFCAAASRENTFFTDRVHPSFEYASAIARELDDAIGF